MDKVCNMKEQELYIIRGASGVGKTTVLKHLKSVLDYGFLIDIDSIREKFCMMDWESGYSEYVNAQKITHVMVMEALRLGYGNVIVTDSFPEGLLKSFIDGIDFPVSVISLYCEPEELRRRLEVRGYPVYHLDKICKLNDAIRKHDLEESSISVNRLIFIDNTHKNENILDTLFSYTK